MQTACAGIALEGHAHLHNVARRPPEVLADIGALAIAHEASLAATPAVVAPLRAGRAAGNERAPLLKGTLLSAVDIRAEDTDGSTRG